MTRSDCDFYDPFEQPDNRPRCYICGLIEEKDHECPPGCVEAWNLSEYHISTLAFNRGRQKIKPDYLIRWNKLPTIRTLRRAANRKHLVIYLIDQRKLKPNKIVKQVKRIPNKLRSYAAIHYGPKEALLKTAKCILNNNPDADWYCPVGLDRGINDIMPKN